MVIIGYQWETMLCLFGQNCRSTYIDDGVLYLKLLELRVASNIEISGIAASLKTKRVKQKKIF